MVKLLVTSKSSAAALDAVGDVAESAVLLLLPPAADGGGGGATLI